MNAALRGRPRRHGMGFTLLELMCAIAVGALVVLACIGVLQALNRTDRHMARRFGEVTDLVLLHQVVQKSMTMLVMSERPAPAFGNAAATPTTQPPPQRDDRAAAPEVRKPRFVLGTDGGGGGLGQSLEVVLAAPPVPPRPRPDLPEGRRTQRRPQSRFNRSDFTPAGNPPPTAGGGGGGPNAGGASNARSGGVRGVFELRPDDPAAGGRRRGPDEGGQQAMTLWWQPIPSPDPDDPDAPVDIDPQDATEIASGLVQCTWRAFGQDPNQRNPTNGQKTGPRDWRNQFQATRAEDLPAYVELEVKTTANVTAQWLFEVGWSSGPEAGDAPEAGPGGGPLSDPNNPGSGGVVPAQPLSPASKGLPSPGQFPGGVKPGSPGKAGS